MRDRPWNTPADFFGGASEQLEALSRRARRLTAIEQRALEPLPASLRAQCRVAALEAGELRIVCASSAWATRLRYYQRALLKALAGDDLFTRRYGSVRRVDVTVTRPAAGAPASSAAPARLSRHAAAHLESVARNEPDAALRSALQRLARHQ